MYLIKTMRLYFCFTKHQNNSLEAEWKQGNTMETRWYTSQDSLSAFGFESEDKILSLKVLIIDKQGLLTYSMLDLIVKKTKK